ncbi:hypothetical protein M3Y99_00768200 [Aphelenchoides fujianensis]|nr:hypothetical protein M3Y99_00768200 [Aphelenchoides fujianensis]
MARKNKQAAPKKTASGLKTRVSEFGAVVAVQRRTTRITPVDAEGTLPIAAAFRAPAASSSRRSSTDHPAAVITLDSSDEEAAPSAAPSAAPPADSIKKEVIMLDDTDDEKVSESGQQDERSEDEAKDQPPDRDSSLDHEPTEFSASDSPIIQEGTRKRVFAHSDARLPPPKIPRVEDGTADLNDHQMLDEDAPADKDDSPNGNLENAPPEDHEEQPTASLSSIDRRLLRSLENVQQAAEDGERAFWDSVWEEKLDAEGHDNPWVTPEVSAECFKLAQDHRIRCTHGAFIREFNNARTPEELSNVTWNAILAYRRRYDARAAELEEDLASTGLEPQTEAWAVRRGELFEALNWEMYLVDYWDFIPFSSAGVSLALEMSEDQRRFAATRLAAARAHQHSEQGRPLASADVNDRSNECRPLVPPDVDEQDAQHGEHALLDNVSAEQLQEEALNPVDEEPTPVLPTEPLVFHMTLRSRKKADDDWDPNEPTSSTASSDHERPDDIDDADLQLAIHRSLLGDNNKPIDDELQRAVEEFTPPQPSGEADGELPMAQRKIGTCPWIPSALSRLFLVHLVLIELQKTIRDVEDDCEEFAEIEQVAATQLLELKGKLLTDRQKLRAELEAVLGEPLNDEVFDALIEEEEDGDGAFEDEPAEKHDFINIKDELDAAQLLDMPPLIPTDPDAAEDAEYLRRLQAHQTALVMPTSTPEKRHARRAALRASIVYYGTCVGRDIEMRTYEWFHAPASDSNRNGAFRSDTHELIVVDHRTASSLPPGFGSIADWAVCQEFILHSWQVHFTGPHLPRIAGVVNPVHQSYNRAHVARSNEPRRRANCRRLLMEALKTDKPIEGKSRIPCPFCKERRDSWPDVVKHVMEKHGKTLDRQKPASSSFFFLSLPRIQSNDEASCDHPSVGENNDGLDQNAHGGHQDDAEWLADDIDLNETLQSLADEEDGHDQRPDAIQEFYGAFAYIIVEFALLDSALAMSSGTSEERRLRDAALRKAIVYYGTSVGRPEGMRAHEWLEKTASARNGNGAFRSDTHGLLVLDHVTTSSLPPGIDSAADYAVVLEFILHSWSSLFTAGNLPRNAGILVRLKMIYNRSLIDLAMNAERLRGDA